MAEKVRAQLKSLFSPDVDPLEQFAPTGPFGISVMAMIGPAHGPGEESFDFMVCTPDWFAARMEGNIAIGRHHIFVKRFDYSDLQSLWKTTAPNALGSLGVR